MIGIGLDPACVREEVFNFKRDVMRGQLRNEVIDLRRPAPTLHVGGNGGEWLAAQDVLYERRQVAAGPASTKSRTPLECIDSIIRANSTGLTQ